MRLALIVDSSYEKNEKLTQIPSAHVDGDLIERRLTEPDAGFKVIRFEAERGLAERIEQRLIAQTEPVDELLVYFSGYTVLSEDRGPALLLDGERLGTLSLTRLRNLFLVHARASCLIVDAAAVVDSGQSLLEVVNSVGQVLTENAPSVSALVAVRNSALPDSFGGSAFTGLVLMVLDWLGSDRPATQEVDIRWLYEGLRADEQMWREVPAAGLFGLETARFTILAAKQRLELPTKAESTPLPSFEMSDAPTASASASKVEALPLPSFALGDVPPARDEGSVPPARRTEPAPLPSFAMGDGGLDELLGLVPSHAPDEAKTQPGATLFDDSEEVTPTRPVAGGAFASPPPEADSGLPSFDFMEATEPNRGFSPASVAPGENPDALPSFDFSEATQPNRADRGPVEGEGSGPRPTPHATASADDLADAGQDEVAARVFEAALPLIQDPHERAGMLARLARVLARLGQSEQAAEHFASAVGLDALNLDVLKVRAEWAEAAGDQPNLLHTAEAWLGLAPGEPVALVLLAKAAEALGDDARSLDVRRQIAASPSCSLSQRLDALRDGARVARDKLSDPALADALEAEAQAVLQAAEAQGPKGPVGASQKPELTEEYERRLAQRPEDMALREKLIRLYQELGERELALEHCRSAARLSPTHAATYRLAHALFEQSGVADGAWNAASVLECLGDADINEALMVSQHKPEGLLAARATINDEEWVRILYPKDKDRALLALLDALGPASVRVGIGFAKLKGRYAPPDPETLQDPEKSTTMLAKTLAWTARLLSLDVPLLYVSPDVPAGLEVLPSESPSTQAARTLGSGLALGQLAFLWGRHLPRFRGELRALSFFPSPPELSALLRAALALGGASGVEVRALDGDSKRLYAALRREVRGPALEQLARIAKAFPLANLEERARRALHAVELLGVRAGLAVSGDVLAAADLIRRFPGGGLSHPDEELAELYVFAISREYGLLRQRMGVAVAA